MNCKIFEAGIRTAKAPYACVTCELNLVSDDSVIIQKGERYRFARVVASEEKWRKDYSYHFHRSHPLTPESVIRLAALQAEQELKPEKTTKRILLFPPT